MKKRLFLREEHIRMLPPTAEITDGEWQHWKSNIRDVFEHGWVGRETAMVMSETNPALHTMDHIAVFGLLVSPVAPVSTLLVGERTTISRLKTHRGGKHGILGYPKNQ